MPIITEAPGDGNDSGTDGECVSYQPLEFRLFGISLSSRNHETSGNCQNMF